MEQWGVEALQIPPTPNNRDSGSMPAGGRHDRQAMHHGTAPAEGNLLGRFRLHVNMLSKLSETPDLVQWLAKVRFMGFVILQKANGVRMYVRVVLLAATLAFRSKNGPLL